MALDDDGHRGVLGSFEGAAQIFELVDRATVDGADHVTRLQPGVARRGAGVHGAHRDWGLDLGRAHRGVDAEEDQHRQRQVER